MPYVPPNKRTLHFVRILYSRKVEATFISAEMGSCSICASEEGGLVAHGQERDRTKLQKDGSCDSCAVDCLPLTF